MTKSKCTKHISVGRLLEVEMSKKCTLLWREAHFQVKMYKKTSAWDHVLEVEMKKCTPFISKSKCTKHAMYGPFWEVQMLKKCTQLWREAYFEVKMYKAHHVRTIFGDSDLEKVHAVVARRTFRSKHVQNTRGSDHFWRLRCRFASLHCITLHYTTFHYISLHFATLHYTTLHYITLQYTTFHYTSLHCTTLHYTTTTTIVYTQLHNYTTTLQYTTLDCTTLHYTTLHYATFHYTSLHYTTLRSTHYKYNYNYTTTQLQNYTPLHSTTLHYITLHYTTLHYATFHYTSLHYTTLRSTTPQIQLQLHNYTTTLH